MPKKSKTFITGRGTKITMIDIYPKENPEGAMEEITAYMAYLGLFEGIDKTLGIKSKDNIIE